MKKDNSKNNFSYGDVDLHFVVRNIDEYIIPECQDACTSLWAKNIGTFMCSNRDELGKTTYILFNNLSDINRQIIDELVANNEPGYYFNDFRNTYGIYVVGGNQEEISKKLVELTNRFKMQDVQEGYYKNIEVAIADKFGFHTIDENGYVVPKLDLPFKLECSEEEFLLNNGLIKGEDGRIWKDVFYSDGHERYLKFLKEIELAAGSEEEKEDRKKELIGSFKKEIVDGISEGGKYYKGYEKKEDNWATQVEIDRIADFVAGKEGTGLFEVPSCFNGYSFNVIFDEASVRKIEKVSDDLPENNVSYIKYGEYTINLFEDGYYFVSNLEGELITGENAIKIIKQCLEDEEFTEKMDKLTCVKLLQIAQNNKDISSDSKLDLEADSESDSKPDSEHNSESEEKRYNYSYVPWHIVEKNIDEYIIPECQDACKALWDKNIGTYMCSNRNEFDDTKYVDLSVISEKNREILEKLISDGVPGYAYDNHRCAYRIYANGEGKEVAKKLTELTKVFEMQDVLEGFFNSTEEALMSRLELCEYIKNPGYIRPPEIDPFDFSKHLKDIDEYKKRTPTVCQNEFLELFSPSRMEKSEEEYLKEEGFIKDEDGRVWKHEFYKQKHEKYLEYLKSQGIEFRKEDFGKLGKNIPQSKIMEARQVIIGHKPPITEIDSN